MEGSILHFDRGSDQGFIRATDGKRYSFTFADWRSSGTPLFGDVVDFEPEEERARAIFIIRPASGTGDTPSAPVETPAPPPSAPPPPMAEAAARPDAPNEDAQALPFWRTTKGMVVIGTIALVAFFGLLWINRYEWLGMERPGPALVGVTGEQASLYVVADANLRSRPTSKGSVAAAKVPRGTKVSGVMQMGEDGKSPWFKLADGRGYIGAVNLSAKEPPRLAKSFRDRDWMAPADLDLRALPDATSLLLESAPAGTKLILAGVTENGFAEVKMTKGGVGYFAAEGIDLESNAAPPIAFSFDPETCGFGGELDRLFAVEFAAQDRRQKAVESASYPDEEAREQASIDYDNKNYYSKLSRSANGLSISAVGVNNGGSFLLFSNSAEQVLTAFRKMGFAIASDGVFTGLDGAGAYIAGTSGDQLSYGKAVLFCGS